MLVPVPYKPANPELAWMVAIFWIGRKPRLTNFRYLMLSGIYLLENCA